MVLRTTAEGGKSYAFVLDFEFLSRTRSAMQTMRKSALGHRLICQWPRTNSWPRAAAMRSFGASTNGGGRRRATDHPKIKDETKTGIKALKLQDLRYDNGLSERSLSMT